jgi:hypothetical protein
MLAWGLLGLSGMLDLGIGRATTKLISDAIARNSTTDVPRILNTALRIAWTTSVIGAFGLGMFLAWFSFAFVKTEASPIEVAFASFVLATSLPFQVLGNTYRGVNEAHIKLEGVSLVRIFLRLSSFSIPLFFSSFSHNLVLLVSSITISRFLGYLLYRRCAFACVSQSELKGLEFCEETRKKLMSFGGWFTVSCIIGPILANVDRIFLSSIVSAIAVSSYSIPHEFGSQSIVLVGAITTVSFPFLSTVSAKDKKEGFRHFHRILACSLFVMLFVSIALFTLGPAIMHTWLGKELSIDSMRTLQIVAVGILPFTLGAVSTSFIHACSRTDLTAKLHLVELVVTVPVTFALIAFYGVTGAATAWVLRVTADGIALYAICILLPLPLKAIARLRTS